MMKRSESSRASLAVLFGICLALVGCDRSDRLPLNGEVSFDGTPVKHGYVQFTPMAATKGPTSGADIKDGAYQVAPVRGLMQGAYRVEIQAWERTGGVSLDPVTGEKFQGGALVQLLPDKYNKQSELTLEIEPGTRTFDFHLKP